MYLFRAMVKIKVLKRELCHSEMALAKRLPKRGARKGDITAA